MSDLSLLFSNVQELSPAAQEIRQPQAEIRNDTWETAACGIAAGLPAEQGLPSGVASMEHWLDLNA
jgi:hypothetical protein